MVEPSGEVQGEIDPIAERWKRFPILKQMTENGQDYAIRAEPGVVLTNEQSDKIFNAIKEGYRLAKQVVGNDYFQGFDNYYLILVKRMGGFMDNGLRTHLEGALHLSAQSISAAIVHECVESWRDDNNLMGEGAPLLTEYLLGGEDIRNQLFEYYTRQMYDDTTAKYSHEKGWIKVIEAFGFRKNNATETKQALKEWKTSLDEGQKVDFIKTKLLNWRQE